MLSTHGKVAEVAVIGAKDVMKGEKPLGFIVLKAGVDRAEADQIIKETYELVRSE